MTRTIQLKRLTRSTDFKRVRAARQHCAMPGVVMQARATPAEVADGGSARLGFTVSRRIGNAVARNRAKRRLRAAAYDVLAQSASVDVDYVLIGRGETLKRPFDALRADIAASLKKLARNLPRQGSGAAPGPRP